MKFSRMKFSTIAAAVTAIIVFAPAAQAREYHHRHRGHYAARSHIVARRQSAADTYAYSAPQPFAYPQRSASQTVDRRRPAAWCGWEMRQLVSGDPGPEFNLARNWSRWGQPGPAGIGAVIVWPHHVGKIVGQEGSAWIIESGNDGHQLRSRARSIAGAIAIRWG